MRHEKSFTSTRSPYALLTFSNSATNLPERSPVSTAISTLPTFSRRAARFHALAYPHFFLRQHLVELGIHHRLVAQHAFFDALIGGEISGKTGQNSSIQFDDARGHIVQKFTVMGDEQHAAD